MTVVARTRIGWMRFQESGEVLYGRKFLLEMKEKVYQICVRSAVLCRSKFKTERAYDKSQVQSEADRLKEHKRINANAGCYCTY